MSAEVLRKELLTVPGVVDAEVDGDDLTPSGVRVKLDQSADPKVVEESVKRILAGHGMRSRVSPPPSSGGPPPPPGAPGSAQGGAVVPITSFETVESAAAQPQPEPERPPLRSAPSVAEPALDQIAVVETRDGVVVTASTVDGRSESRRARWSEGELNEAVIAAVAALVGNEPQPLVLAVEERELGGVATVTVVLERTGGKRVSGSAVVEAGAPFALGKAVWAALQ